MSTTIPDLRELLVRIDARLGSIVKDIDELKTDAKELRKDTQHLRVELAEIKGRMANIPTIYATFMISFGVLGLLPLLATLAVYGLRRFGVAS